MSSQLFLSKKALHVTAANSCLLLNFDGHRNYYLLDRQKQTAVQLTHGRGDNTFGGFLSPDDRSLYYVKNERELRRVSLDDYSEHTIYTVPEEWVGYGTWGSKQRMYASGSVRNCPG